MDTVSTCYGIEIQSLAEMNPLADFFFQNNKIASFILIKLFVSFSIVLLYLLSKKYFPKWHWPLEISLKVGNLGM